MDRLRESLGYTNERYRLFEVLTKPQQTAVREAIPCLDPYEQG